MKLQSIRRLVLGAAVCLLAAADPALAQPAPWPSRPITIVVPFGAGSVTDQLARIVGQNLSESLGQPVVIENKAGADGNIGAAYVAGATPDGYTLLMGAASTNAINPSLHKNLRFNPLRDFAPITNIAAVPNVLVVGPSVKARTVKDFVQAARTEKYSYASSGAGGSMHLSGELFKVMTKTPDMLHIPFKGGSAPVTEVMAGRISAMFCNLPLCLQHIKAGKLTALGAAPHAAAAGRPHHRRGRGAGLRSGRLVRLLRAGRRAQADHRPAEQGSGGHAPRPQGQGETAGPGRRAGRRNARGIRRLRQEGTRSLGEDHRRGRHHAPVTSRRATE